MTQNLPRGIASLPIDEILSELLETLKSSPSVVLCAPPGAGKTTRVPVAILNSLLLDAQRPECVLLQPRRIAVRAAATRIAEEIGASVGGEVGYQVRFENRTSAQTRLRVVTEGILARQFHDDPFLERVGCVILDEFHERSVHSDLALAMLRDLQRGAREDLRILVMSATLEAQSIARFLGDCPILVSQGQSHPVELLHRARRSKVVTDLQGFERDVCDAVSDALLLPGAPSGHVLVFLPGVGEIRRCEEALGPLAGRCGLKILTLHGSLSAAEQDQVLQPLPSAGPQRKLILATNVAETSLTLEGVRIVVDSGLARVTRWEPRLGLSRLELARISMASAIQRAGRAGRQGPGRVLRMWSAAEERSMRPYEVPEIARCDLSPSLLVLADWGVRDALQWDWFEKPPESALRAGYDLLFDLGVCDRLGQLTPLGKQLGSLPMSPRLAVFLLRAAASGDRGLADQACAVAALLSERDIFRFESRSPPASVGDSDLDARLHALETGECVLPGALLDRSALQAVTRALTSYRRLVRPHVERAVSETPSAVSMLDCLLAGFPDRVARRRASGEARGRLTGGRGVVVSASSCVQNAELFLVLDAQETRAGGALEARVSLAVALTEADLRRNFPNEIAERDEGVFDESSGLVRATRALAYRDLLLRDPVPVMADADMAERLLLETLCRDPQILFTRLAAVQSWLTRWNFLHQKKPESWSLLGDEIWQELLPSLCEGRSRLADITQEAVLMALKSRIGYDQVRLFEQWAPAQLEVPSGRMLPLHYEVTGQVILSVRLQEIFGWTETPRLGGGSVSVVLELLAPNFRPVQVTQDLASFWRTAYPTLRRELKIKYPKHSWPENPIEALPQAKGRGFGKRGQNS